MRDKESQLIYEAYNTNHEKPDEHETNQDEVEEGAIGSIGRGLGSVAKGVGQAGLGAAKGTAKLTGRAGLGAVGAGAKVAGLGLSGVLHALEFLTADQLQKVGDMAMKLSVGKKRTSRK